MDRVILKEGYHRLFLLKLPDPLLGLRQLKLRPFGLAIELRPLRLCEREEPLQHLAARSVDGAIGNQRRIRPALDPMSARTLE
jgi:hypothetical protein